MSESPGLIEESAVEPPSALDDGDYQYDARFLSRVVEGALLAQGSALSLDRLLGLFEDDKRPSRQQLLEVLTAIAANQEDRGFKLREVASGWRFEVCDDLAPWVNRLWEEKPQKYSRALLETLALIAYRQPLTRGDIEDVRGVAVSSHIIKTLIEREWVKVVGHRDVPGRPALYATTRHFLDYFALKSLEELPSLGELKDIDGLSEKFELESAKASRDTANDDAVVEPCDDPSIEVCSLALGAEMLELEESRVPKVDLPPKQITDILVDSSAHNISPLEEPAETLIPSEN